MRHLFLILISALVFVSCQKDSAIIEVEENSPRVESRSSSLVSICHNGRVIQVNPNSLQAHRNHGDAVDSDDDGYFDIANDCSLTDCDDTDPSINPDSEEICDGLDNNCDGNIDEGVTTTYYADSDGDGFGNPESSTEGCDPPSGYVEDNTDCDDNNSNIYPGAPSNNGDAFFDNFNDCNLNEYTYSGGNISIASGLSGCGVYMTHFRGQQPNNFYPTGKEFLYGEYEVDAKANDYISDNFVRLFNDAPLNSNGWHFSFRPNNTDNPGVYIIYGGRFFSSTSIPVSRGQWYNIRIKVTETALQVFINNNLYFEDLDLENLPMPPTKGFYKLGVAYSGTFDNMKFTPLTNDCNQL